MTNSVDPYQTALGLHFLLRTICPNTLEFLNKGEWVHFHGKQITLSFLPFFSLGSTLKRKEFAPTGANSFLYE